MTTAYKNMSETITAGLMTLADKVVAKRDSRVKFIVKPDKKIANLAAQKNAAARKEVKARRRGQSAGILGHFFFVAAGTCTIGGEKKTRVGKEGI
jgi:hypothetical protein